MKCWHIPLSTMMKSQKWLIRPYSLQNHLNFHCCTVLQRFSIFRVDGGTNSSSMSLWFCKLKLFWISSAKNFHLVTVTSGRLCGALTRPLDSQQLIMFTLLWWFRVIPAFLLSEIHTICPDLLQHTLTFTHTHSTNSTPISGGVKPTLNHDQCEGSQQSLCQSSALSSTAL